jgi:hypothetical protein
LAAAAAFESFSLKEAETACARSTNKLTADASVSPGTSDAKRFATGGQDLQLRTGEEQPLGERRAGLDEVFTVVEHEELLLFAQGIDEQVDGRTGAVLETERIEDIRGQQVSIDQRCQLDPGDAATELRRRAICHLGGKTCLPAPARTREGDEAGFVEE